jgi:DNA repair exonuclease SbcCD ATPase subunit
MPDPTSVTLAELYAAAADDIENRQYFNWVGGPAVWRALHTAVHDLVTAPLVEGVRRREKLDQVQQWDADQETVVKALRALAEDSEPLGVLQDASAENRIARVEAVIRDALGYSGDVNNMSLAGLVQDAADKLRRLQRESEQLRAEVERLRKALRSSESRRTVTEEKIHRVETVRCWTNEDGKDFMFAEDLREALADKEATNA